MKQVLLDDTPGKEEGVDWEQLEGIYEGDIMTTATGFGDEGRVVDVIYLHFSLTFETISHNILVSSKDIMFWIGGQINQFKNWLGDWAERVVVNTTLAGGRVSPRTCPV